MPVAAPAAASSAIWLVAESASGGSSKTTGCADRTGPHILDVQKRRRGGAALKEHGRARAGAGDQEGHVVERRPAGAVDDLLHDRREVGRTLGKAGLTHRGPAGRRPSRRSVGGRARGDVELDGGEGGRVVRVLAPDQQRRGTGARLVRRELDVGAGDDGAMRDVDAGEADPDRLAGWCRRSPSSRSLVLLDIEPEDFCSTSSPAAATLVSKIVGPPVTLTLKAWVAALPSDEVAVTVRVTVGSDWASSVPVPERVMTPVVAPMAKRGSLTL